MSVNPSWKATLGILLSLLCVNGASFLQSAELYAQGQIKAIYRFPDLSIKEFQNAKFPDSVVNDRKVLLGSVGSDLWRSPSDPPGEFWMVTDRGPNGQVRVDGKNRRTFWVPEFNPTILRIKTEGDSIHVLQTLPIVGASGKPVTGMPNLKDFDETPYDYAAQKELTFNVSGLDTEGLVHTKSGEFWLTDEYSPSLVRVDANGKVVKRYVPAGLNLPASGLSGGGEPAGSTRQEENQSWLRRAGAQLGREIYLFYFAKPAGNSRW